MTCEGHWPRWWVAGEWAADGISICVRRTSDRDHEVSILIAAMDVVGRYCGEQPRAKVSMMIMRPLQQGRGCESICGSLASAFVALLASRSGARALSSWR